MNPMKETTVYTQFSGVSAIKKPAKNSDQQLKATAQQFEALFLQMALKSMREANQALGKGIFASDQMDLYQDLWDKQLSLNLSHQNSLGLADVIVKQLSQASLAKKLNGK